MEESWLYGSGGIGQVSNTQLLRPAVPAGSVRRRDRHHTRYGMNAGRQRPCQAHDAPDEWTGWLQFQTGIRRLLANPEPGSKLFVDVDCSLGLHSPRAGVVFLH